VVLGGVGGGGGGGGGGLRWVVCVGKLCVGVGGVGGVFGLVLFMLRGVVVFTWGGGVLGVGSNPRQAAVP